MYMNLLILPLKVDDLAFYTDKKLFPLVKTGLNNVLLHQTNMIVNNVVQADKLL